MLEASRGLPSRALRAVADLERRVVSADGGRLKLEWGTLSTRPADQVNDLLWWDGDRLLGFLGLYAFGGAPVELAGMVDPAVRRQGIGGALLDAALTLCRDRGYAGALLVVPRSTPAGRHFAVGRGGVLDHSEHALVLSGPPAAGPGVPGLELRPAELADVDVVTRLLGDAFGQAPADVAGSLRTEAGQTLLACIDGAPAGVVRRERHGTVGGIYGLAVDPRWQAAA